MGKKKYTNMDGRRINNKKSRVREVRVAIIKLTASVVLGILLIAYISGVVYYSSHYLEGTVINGIDVSKMTVEELEHTIASYALTIKERGIEDNDVYVEGINGTDIDMQIVSDSGISDILKAQNQFLWFKKGNHTYTKEMLIDYDEEKLQEAILQLKGFNKKHANKPTDATVSEYKEGKGYSIIKEKQGNFLDKNKTKEAVTNAVCNLETEINLEEADCYLKPSVYAEDEELKDLISDINTYTGVEITYTFGENVETVNGSMIAEWIVIDNFKADLDSELVAEYVATLRKKYDTIFRDRTFTTSYGKTVTVKGGDYGWWMNYVKEAEELTQMIKGGMSGERKPVYYQEAAQYGANDYGDTYVEINLTAQHLFLYKDGTKILETDFVSGNTSAKMGTPVGTYGITYKERYSVLVGETYESTVSYWMPFNGDIGMHDAIWKTQFGKDFYKKDGSHGCINLPYLTAKKIYQEIEKGTPVICYKLSGTESQSVTSQSAEEIAQAAIEAIDAIGKVTKESQDEIDTARYMYNKVSKEAKKYVTNYDVLKAAEKKMKKIKKKTNK